MAFLNQVWCSLQLIPSVLSDIDRVCGSLRHSNMSRMSASLALRMTGIVLPHIVSLSKYQPSLFYEWIERWFSVKKILITGGAGFIGSRLAQELSRDHEVHILDNLHQQVHDSNPANINRIKDIGADLTVVDIRDAEAVKRIISAVSPDVVYHFAAETGTGQSFDLIHQYTDVNVMGTVNLIEAIKALSVQPKRVVLAGSRSVYGEGACMDETGQLHTAQARSDADLRVGDYQPKSASGLSLKPVASSATTPVMPASIYASTKLMQEYLLSQAFWGSGVDVPILRLQNVFGAGQSLNNPYTGVLSIFCRQIMESKTLNIYEDGEITRDFIDVRDVVSAFSKLARRESVPSEIVDIGSGQGITILDVAQKLMTLLDVPTDRLEITGNFRPGDIRFAVADVRRAQELIDWVPETELDQSLADLVDWAKTVVL